MNSSEIFQAIEQIAATSSKNEKQALVKKYADDAEFQKVLVYTYDPFKIYGIAAVPVRNSDYGLGCWFNEGANTWKLLDDLVARKLTGNAAREAVQGMINHLNDDSAELLRRIIKKDLRAGFSESTINKAVKDLIPDPPYMRCSLPKDVDLSKFDWKTGVVSQEKADGMFANLTFESVENLSLTSRQGSLFPPGSFNILFAVAARRLAPGYQYHGELLVRKAGIVMPREQSNGVLNSVFKGGDFEPDEQPIYHIWDAIPISEVKTKGKFETPYRKRLGVIIEALMKDKSDRLSGGSISLVPTRIVHSLEEAYKHYAELLKKGKEGTIIKDPRAIWKDGTSRSMCKLKLEVEVDLEVIEFLPGEGKNEATFGSILTQTSDGLLQVAVSGFTDAMRLYLWENDEEMIGKIITVRANSIMYPAKNNELHSLFLPRFIEVRNDKSEADSLQRVIDQFESAVKKAA